MSQDNVLLYEQLNLLIPAEHCIVCFVPERE